MHGVWCLGSIAMMGLQDGSSGLDCTIPHGRTFVQVVTMMIRRSIELHLVMDW